MDSFIICVLFTLFFSCLIFYYGVRNEYINAIESKHYKSLFFILLSSVAMWVALVLMGEPSGKFKIDIYDKIALVFTILTAIFVWGRLVFTLKE